MKCQPGCACGRHSAGPKIAAALRGTSHPTSLTTEQRSKAATTHGMSRTRTYTSWCSMRSRCSKPNNASYPRYGGRGITVCDRWLDSFAAFLADLGVRPEGKSLDRIDPDGNYEPGNVRWATPAEQQRHNRRQLQWPPPHRQRHGRR